MYFQLAKPGPVYNWIGPYAHAELLHVPFGHEEDKENSSPEGIVTHPRPETPALK